MNHSLGSEESGHVLRAVRHARAHQGRVAVLVRTVGREAGRQENIQRLLSKKKSNNDRFERNPAEGLGSGVTSKPALGQSKGFDGEKQRAQVSNLNWPVKRGFQKQCSPKKTDVLRETRRPGFGGRNLMFPLIYGARFLGCLQPPNCYPPKKPAKHDPLL